MTAEPTYTLTEAQLVDLIETGQHAVVNGGEWPQRVLARWLTEHHVTPQPSVEAEAARLRTMLQTVRDWLADCWEPGDRYYGFGGMRDDIDTALAAQPPQ